MPVFIQIPENPNCAAVEGQVFQCRARARTVTHVRWERDGSAEWCPVVGLEEGGAACPATACLVEDSGEGMCYLVVGGEWGLRFKRPADGGEWSIGAAGQWGESFLLLAGDDRDLRFQD